MPLLDHEPVRDAALEAQLRAQLPGPVYAYDTLVSTMDRAHALAAEGAPEWTVVYARQQQQGRGRLGRVWVSPAGGAYWSVILRPNTPGRSVPQLALVAGLAIAEAIEQETALSPTIRWPNDVLIEHRKLAGVLSEARDRGVVIGMGVNVTTARADLPEQATSLHLAGATQCSAITLTGRTGRVLHQRYQQWAQDGFTPIREALRGRMGLFGTPVQAAIGSTTLQGVPVDLDDEGRLLLRLDSGIVRPLAVAEVSRLT